MKRPIFLALLALSMLVPAFARASDLVIGSGSEQGYYHEVATRLATVLRSEYETVTEVVPSNGSLENLKNLVDPASSVSLGLVQADALRFYLRNRKDATQKLEVLTSIGRECAFLVAGRQGRVREFADLKSPKILLALPAEQSGARVTFASMKNLDPALGKAGLLGLTALEALLGIKSGAVDAALFVQRPRAVPPLEIVLENQDLYQFVSIPAGEVPNAKLPDGSPVYTFGNVKLGFGKNFSASVDTVCTRGLLIGSKSKLSVPNRDLVARALVASGRYILPGTR